jgi:hypothetical protein
VPCAAQLNFKLLMDLHETAEKHNDAQMTDFVEDMLAEQVPASFPWALTHRCILGSHALHLCSPFE